MKEMMYDKTVMGNRKTLLKGTDNFEQFINRNEIGQKINNFLKILRYLIFFLQKFTKIKFEKLRTFRF